jgi:hypothetical protein
VWKTAIDEGEAIRDDAQMTKEEVELDEVYSVEEIEEKIAELNDLIKELDEGILGNIAKSAGKTIAKGAKAGAKKVGGAIKKKAAASKVGKAVSKAKGKVKAGADKAKAGAKKAKDTAGKIKKAAKTGKAYGDAFDPMLERLEIIESKLNDYYEILEKTDLDEGKMKELHGYIQDGKSAKEIAKIMKLDVKTIKALMSGYKEEVELDEHGDSHVNPKDREELDKTPSDTAKKMKRSKEPAPNISEASGDKEAYKKFFDAALKKFKVTSPAELKGDQKKKFYDYIDAGWEGDNEKAEGAMSQVREFKIQSMKAALAQVWGMEEGKNPFKTEDDDEENKKRVKTETGKKAAVIDLKPKTKD